MSKEKTLNILGYSPYDPKQGLTDDEIKKLAELGYAPGFYHMPKCSYCGKEYTAEKRAIACRDCAEKLVAKPKVTKVGSFTENGFPVDWEFEGFNPMVYIPSGTWTGFDDKELLKIMRFCGYTVDELREVKESNTNE